jgi:hypothetical protein
MKPAEESFWRGIQKAAANAPLDVPTDEKGRPLEAPRIRPEQSIRRHYQFSDLQFGSWYIEIVASTSLFHFFVQEIRNGEVVKRTRDAKAFGECLKLFWDRTHKMSLEAGFESLPPPVKRIEWK